MIVDIVLINMFFRLYIFGHVQIMKNHAVCYTFSCVNVKVN